MSITKERIAKVGRIILQFFLSFNMLMILMAFGYYVSWFTISDISDWVIYSVIFNYSFLPFCLFLIFVFVITNAETKDSKLLILNMLVSACYLLILLLVKA